MNVAAMTQDERLLWLISALKAEHREYATLSIPNDRLGRRALLRGLMNVRMPEPVSDEFLSIQDAYLQERAREKGIVETNALAAVATVGAGELVLWQGDITTLSVDAVVNAANNQMLGCFVPGHACIDNAIHTFAGVQLRLACAELMAQQGHLEPTGTAKITPGFNLPARHVLHTVGPIVRGAVTKHDRDLLASCYRSCLELAHARGLTSVAFCCISTGEFCYPNEDAAQVALATVCDFLGTMQVPMRVVFNVFKDIDLHIYEALLATL